MACLCHIFMLIILLKTGYSYNCSYFFKLIQNDKIVLHNATDKEVESLHACLLDETLVLRLLIQQSKLTLDTLVFALPDRVRKTLSVLIITNSEVRKVPGDVLSNLTSLNSIDFACNRISEMEQNAFQDMDKVSSIDLSFNNLTKISARTFINLPNLMELKLNGNNLAFISPDAFSNVPELDVVYLDNNELQDIPYDAFKNSPIEYWHIASNNIEEISSQIGQFANLVSIDVSGNNLKTVSWQLSTLQHLERLFLNENHLTTLPEELTCLIVNRSFHIVLENNPLHCDCDLLWLIIIHQNGMLFEDLNCTTPENISMNSFVTTDVVCKQGIDSSVSGLTGYKIVAVILSATVVICACLAIVALFLFRTRTKGIKRPIRMILNGQYYRPRSVADIAADVTGCSNTVQYTSFEGYEVPKLNTSNGGCVDSKQYGSLRLGQLIGRGAFGDVFEGFASDINNVWRKVAVKKMRGNARIDESETLAIEYRNLSNIGNHPNVIQMFGTGEINGSMIMVLEFADNGDLLAHLKKLNQVNSKVIQNLDSSEWKAYLQKSHPRMFVYMWHIAKGMDHLSKLQIIHRDLAARNILLTHDHVAKISDFGLSRDVYENGYYYQCSNGRMPYKWMSPESLSNGRYTPKSDIWSYGILLWEIMTLGAGPYPGIPPDMLQEMYKQNYVMPSPPLCPENIYSIMKECWSFLPERRPEFYDLLDKLDKFLQTVGNKESYNTV